MRRLFFKIFGWFWLAQVFIGFVMFQVGAATRPLPDSGRWRATSSALLLQAHAAAAVYQNAGAAALNRELRHLQERTNLPAFAFDEQGKQIAGQTPPLAARNLVQRAATSSKAEFLFADDILLGACAAQLANGRKMVVVVEVLQPRRRPPPGFLPRFIPREFRDFSGTGWIRMLALLATSGLVCYGLALYLTSPAVKLRRATRQLASGDLSTRIGRQMGRRRDELADLGRDFDQMAERIETLMVSERRLLADISHELRSPLARLTVALDLADGGTDPPTQGYLHRIRREAERLNELIGQLLSLSRLESGSARVQNRTVDLANLLQDVAHDADFEARSRNRRVRVLDCAPCSTVGDMVLLRSAVENVVRNAVHYTAEDTEVTLSLTCVPRAKNKVPNRSSL
jgi:two-component system sensor histidine kinase CpxA